jgi:hypothetical protein
MPAEFVKGMKVRAYPFKMVDDGLEVVLPDHGWRKGVISLFFHSLTRLNGPMAVRVVCKEPLGLKYIECASESPISDSN